MIDRCIIGNGSEIYGEVHNSVIGSGVVIGEGTVVRDSIIMKDAVIGKNCVVDKAIIAENCKIGDECCNGNRKRCTEPPETVRIFFWTGNDWREFGNPGKSTDWKKYCDQW